MTASMYQGSGLYNSVVGEKMKGHLPGPHPALKQGSEGPTMSDLQFMMQNEQKQHEQNYLYARGHNDHGLGQ
jgi:hypothetical protein